MGQLLYLKDVTTLRLDQRKCAGCGMCLVVCPHGVFGLTNSKAQIEHWDACMECGACARNCPAEAISVRAGVGCAAAVIRNALGRKATACCGEGSCQIDPQDQGVCCTLPDNAAV